MTPDELAAIKARAEAATEGPWYWRNTGPVYLLGKASRCVMAFSRKGMQEGQPEFRGDDNLMTKVVERNIYDFADARFIAHARQDIPDLLAEVERLTAVVEAVRGLHRPWRPMHPKNVAYPGLCSVCRGKYGAYLSWPCPTIRALEGEGA